MITSYRIKNINEENVLFLYIDSVEFSLSWLQNFRDFSIKKFLSSHHLNFDGNKVILVLSSGAIITLLLTNTPYKNNTNYNVEYIPNIIDILSDKALITNDNKTDTDSPFSDNKVEIGNVTTNIDNNKTNETNDINNSNPKEQVTSSSKSDSNTSNKTNNNSSTDNTNQGSSSGTTNTNNSENSHNASKNNPDIDPSIKPSENTNILQNNELQVTIKRGTGTTVTLGMTDYLIGVVAAEMPASFNLEALKAQAILARTYAFKRIKNNLILTDTTSTQVYKDNNQLRNLWGENFDTYYQKIRSAVIATDKEVCLYNGNYIDAVYHSTSNGMTEDAVNVWGNSVPYLVSVTSSSDTTVSSYLKTVDFDNTHLLKIFGIDISSLKIEILSRNQSGRVDKVSVNNQVYSGVQFRNLLGLRSSDFDIVYSNNGISITTRGFGHGVGMSQYGANGMANQGYSYKQILSHYYTDITIEKTAF